MTSPKAPEDGPIVVASSGAVLETAPPQLYAEALMYTGTLINDLMDTVERVCDSAVDSLAAAAGPKTSSDSWRIGGSKPKQFSESLGLSAADRNLGLLLVVHPQLVRTFEPGHNFADTVDVHEVGSVGAPK